MKKLLTAITALAVFSSLSMASFAQTTKDEKPVRKPIIETTTTKQTTNQTKSNTSPSTKTMKGTKSNSKTGCKTGGAAPMKSKKSKHNVKSGKTGAAANTVKYKYKKSSKNYK